MSFATPLRLFGGGVRAAVPKGPLVRQLVLAHEATTGTVKGCWVVTLKGPLIPKPALADSSVKYSPRSAYIPKPPRSTRFFADDGLQANHIRGTNIHCRPVRVESPTFLKQTDLLFPATTRPIPGSPLARVPNESVARSYL